MWWLATKKSPSQRCTAEGCDRDHNCSKGYSDYTYGEKKKKQDYNHLMDREAMKPPALIETGLAKTQASSSAFPVTSVLAISWSR